MGGDARAAIIAESAKRGTTPFLPPAVPFGSKQWPTLITPGPGPPPSPSCPDRASPEPGDLQPRSGAP